jgi:nicotinate-nucleotide--dimethylbenzimidazole phosphoribosyltransferase
MSHERGVTDLLSSVRSTDSVAEERAWERLDSLTKPPRSLGRLEQLAARVARVQDTTYPDVSSKMIVLVAADHGVVAEGVSPYPQDVTWQMVANIASGGAAINQIAQSVDAGLRVVDVGVARDISEIENVQHAKIASGTQNMMRGPAMSAEEAARAVLLGADIASEVVSKRANLIGTGEMGIGNTTAAAALAAAYTDCDPAAVVGAGTGLDADGVAHKAQVVKESLRVNDTAEKDALGILASVGGLEIAALAGVMIGAAAKRTCVVSDGFISGVAALTAVRLCPVVAEYIFPSHLSVEPGHRLVLQALGLEPVLELDMRLGEGTGAALAMGIIDSACRMMAGMVTFAEAGVSEETGQ